MFIFCPISSILSYKCHLLIFPPILNSPRVGQQKIGEARGLTPTIFVSPLSSFSTKSRGRFDFHFGGKFLASLFGTDGATSYRVTHLLAEKVTLTSVPSRDKLSMRRN